MSPAPPERAYFEDVELDSRHETPAMTVTEAHVMMYAGLTGDAAPAPGTAPELLALALSTGLGWRIERPPLVVLAFMGLEWTIKQPLRVGDTIRSRSRTATKRGMREAATADEAAEAEGDDARQRRAPRRPRPEQAAPSPASV